MHILTGTGVHNTVYQYWHVYYIRRGGKASGFFNENLTTVETPVQPPWNAHFSVWVQMHCDVRKTAEGEQEGRGATDVNWHIASHPDPPGQRG